ncbi:MAG: hypothetical protein IPG61_08135 [bacterium]|nr:hypothetical protein [bacterium]
MPFEFEHASLALNFAVDNFLGRPGAGVPGVYLNGTAILGSMGGDHNIESFLTWPEVGGLLHSGQNHLYLLAVDTGYASGLPLQRELRV